MHDMLPMLPALQGCQLCVIHPEEKTWLCDLAPQQVVQAAGVGE